MQDPTDALGAFCIAFTCKFVGRGSNEENSFVNCPRGCQCGETASSMMMIDEPQSEMMKMSMASEPVPEAFPTSATETADRMESVGTTGEATAPAATPAEAATVTDNEESPIVTEDDTELVAVVDSASRNSFFFCIGGIVSVLLIFF